MKSYWPQDVLHYTSDRALWRNDAATRYLCPMIVENLRKRLPWWPVALATGLTIALLVLFFPNKASFRYAYEVGKPWRYDDLYAPVTFPILKSEEELAATRQSIEQHMPPVYVFDEGMERVQLERFSRAFAQRLEDARVQQLYDDLLHQPDTYRKLAAGLLHRAYQRGIFELEEAHRNAPPDFVLQVVRGNTVSRLTRQEVQTVEEVRALLSDSLLYSQLPEAEFLLFVTDLVVPNVHYSDSLTRQWLANELAKVSLVQGVVNEGELIVPRGGIVTPEVAQKLKSYQAELARQMNSVSRYSLFVGYLLLTLLVLGVYLMWLWSFVPFSLERFSILVFLLMWFVLFGFLTWQMEGTAGLSAWMVPFCIVPIVVKTFFSERLAVLTHLAVVLQASILTSLGYEFTFLELLAGMMAVLGTTDTRDWGRFFRLLTFIMMIYLLGYLGLVLIREGHLALDTWAVAAQLVVASVLTMLAFPLIPLLERVFGFISPITLVELSDLNRPLLKELSFKAPGTLQHSLQVGHLAEAVANAIGANALLLKTAALYHDIGKMVQPHYFVENQSRENPHDQLSPKESAQIIISHVTEGLKLARKYKLPPALSRFIPTHHGTSRVEYFYRNWLATHPQANKGPVDDSDFRYPGPKPFTREEAILMVVDSVEAAARSLNKPTGKDLDELVDKIVAQKMADGQFDESELSFHDLVSIKDVLKKQLRSVHHVRVEYPKGKEKVQPDDKP